MIKSCFMVASAVALWGCTMSPAQDMTSAASVCTAPSPAFAMWETRIPPVTPVQITRSGWCDAVLDVDAAGAVSAVRSLTCTDKALERTSRASILKWSAAEGHSACGVEARLSYLLSDGEGNVIPARGGHTSWDSLGGTVTTGMRVRRR